MDERRLRFEIRKQKKLSQVVVRTEMKLFMFDKTEDQNTKLICFYFSAVSVFICLKKKLPKNCPNQICDYWLITPSKQTLCIETNIF